MLRNLPFSLPPLQLLAEPPEKGILLATEELHRFTARTGNDGIAVLQGNVDLPVQREHDFRILELVLLREHFHLHFLIAREHHWFLAETVGIDTFSDLKIFFL